MATFVKFPGTAGNFIFSDDVNKLDCDSSWFVQGTGGLWTVGAPSTEQALGDSPRSLKVTGGVSTAITPATDAANFSLFVFSATGDDFDINGGTPVTSAGTWAKVADAGNAGTYTVNAAGVGDYYVAQVMLGAAEFVPSLRIVGDLDLRARVACTDWTPDLDEYRLLSTFDGTSGSMFRVTLDGRWQVIFYAPGSGLKNALSTAFPNLPDGSLVTARATVNGATGDTVTFYVDDVQLGNPVDTGADVGILPNGESLIVGASPGGVEEFLDGDMYWAEVRDGIGGPVVARFDAEDVPVVAQLPSP